MDPILTVPIECKKNNPGFIDWVFFLKQLPPVPGPVYLQQITNVRGSPREDTVQADAPMRWTVEQAVGSIQMSQFQADAAWETRGTYQQYRQGDKTKTSNAAIAGAASQVALGVKALVAEEASFSQVLGGGNPGVAMPYTKQVFLPVIVTTANLVGCAFDASEVDPESGEIPWSKAKLLRLPSLLYQYPLPKKLQGFPADVVRAVTTGVLDAFVRMHILVVHSAAFPKFLRDLVGAGPGLVGSLAGQQPPIPPG